MHQQSTSCLNPPRHSNDTFPIAKLNNMLGIYKKAIGLYTISVINLLVMHYYLLLTCRVEEAIDAVLWIDNLFGITFDITVLISIFMLITWGRPLLSLFITSITTLLWSFSNILYSRFFHHYISLSAISQIGTLTDSFMLQNIFEGIKWFDIVFIFIGIISCWIYITSKGAPGKINSMRIILSIPFCLLIADIISHALFCLITPCMASSTYFTHRLLVRHVGSLHGSAEPNWAFFHRGTIRQVIIPPIYQTFTTTELSKEQIVEIEKEYKNHKQRKNSSINKIKNKNIIFIIVESYLSVTSDLKVKGKEITPFLNSLKHDSTVYYNGQLTSNIAIGESSDGQFIYMTGILPLRSDVTVTKAKYAELPGLPKILKKDKIIKESHMIIPTLPSMWEQEAMCEKYGFDHLYSSADYKEGKYWYLSDQQIFEFALEKDILAPRPFFSVILTMAMHPPYTEPKDSTFIIKDQSLTEKYRNYLNTCHYTDKQIQKYFNQLKQKGLFDNSIIVIVADHHAHPDLFDMPKGSLPIEIPLYIINACINNFNACQEPCNQLDVYTTILDIVGYSGLWLGLGHTLTTSDYETSVSPKLWSISKQIVIGNYFK